MIAKTSHSDLKLSGVRRLAAPDSESHEVTMPVLHSAPTADHYALPVISDDECLLRLAAVVDHHQTEATPDDDHLDELAGLIGRLAVPIEL